MHVGGKLFSVSLAGVEFEDTLEAGGVGTALETCRRVTGIAYRCFGMEEEARADALPGAVRRDIAQPRVSRPMISSYAFSASARTSSRVRGWIGCGTMMVL